MLKYAIQSNFSFDNANAINFINLGKDDLLEILNIRNDIRISKWMFSNKEITQQEHFEFIKMLNMQTDRIYLAIKNKNQEILGVISLTNINLDEKSAYIGIYTNPNINAQNGSLLMQIIKHIGFKQMRLKKLFAQCLKGNNKALKFYAKEGFKEWRIIPNYINKYDKFIDVIELILTKE